MHAGAMRVPAQIAPSQSEVAELLVEVERYLAVVDAFRAEGAEPTWAEENTTRA
jgi:hypothetical protein